MENQLKNEAKRLQRSQSLMKYLCVTLRFTLRSLRLNKKTDANCEGNMKKMC